MSIYQDYGTSTGLTSSGGNPILGIIQGFLGMFAIMLILVAVVSIVLMIAQWKIFKKAGKPGWYSIIPFLNMWTLFEISGLHGWLSLIPIINTFALWVVYYKLAIKFGKSSGFAICTVLFPIICLPILAFGKDAYEGNNVDNNNFNNNQNYQYNHSVAAYQQVEQPMSFVPVQPLVNDVPVQNDIFNQPQVAVDNQVVNQPIEKPVPFQSMENIGTEQNVVQPDAGNSIVRPAKVCPSCNKLNVSTSTFCEDCGTKL